MGVMMTRCQVAGKPCVALFCAHPAEQIPNRRNLFVEVARQTAVNLTTTS